MFHCMFVSFRSCYRTHWKGYFLFLSFTLSQSLTQLGCCPTPNTYILSSGSRVFAPILSTLKIHPGQALGVLRSNSLLALTHFLASSFIIRSSVPLDVHENELIPQEIGNQILLLKKIDQILKSADLYTHVKIPLLYGM